jgi:cold shock CspA family protein
VNAPSRETIDFVSRILGARKTPPGELTAVIAAIASGLDALHQPPAEPIRPRVPVITRAPAPEPVPAEVPVRRPRARRVVHTPAAEPPVAETPVEPPPQPRLLRRAEVAPAEPPPRLPTAKPAGGAVKGVVKWFDSKAGKGALRLTGIAGDVALDPAMLQRSGIRRLYKDQEIEATIEQSGDRVKLLSLVLPGRSSAASSSPLGALGRSTRHQPRQVTVEVKRDGFRQKLARAEAEQILGTTDTIRNPRRIPS